MQKKCRNVGQNNEKITNRADLNGGEISVPFVHEQLVGIEFPASPPRRPETFFFSLRTVSYKNEFSVILHSLWNFSEGDADPDFKEHTLLINALNRIFAGFITTHWSPPSGPWPENIFVSCSPHFFTNSKFWISTNFLTVRIYICWMFFLICLIVKTQNSGFGIRDIIWWPVQLFLYTYQTYYRLTWTRTPCRSTPCNIHFIINRKF